MRNEGLKCTRNDYPKWLLQHVLNTLLSKGDFIIINNLTSES
jgi:hypothetical protein